MTAITRSNHACYLSNAPHAHLFAERLLADEWVIMGMTRSGELFDVPDWTERLCGMLATRLQDKRIRYSEYLRPAHIDGLTAVVVATSLEQDHPACYAIVKRFVAEHQLHSHYSRTERSKEAYPALQRKLREYIKG